MRRILHLLAAALVAACANTPDAAVHSQGYAIVDFTRTQPDDPTIAPAALLALDGQAFINGKAREHVAPGFHYLRVMSSRLGQNARMESMPFAIQAAPCTRYFLAARHPVRQTPKQWKVVVIGEEPIDYCTPPES